LKEAQDVGLLPRDIKVSTALSYFTRSWNRQALDQNPELFKGKAVEYFIRSIRAHGLADVDIARARQSAAEFELEAVTRADFHTTLPDLPKYPAIDLLKSAGGVREGSPLAFELQNLGVTKKQFPGLFKKDGGISSADNLSRDPDGPFGTGFDAEDANADIYVGQNEILDAVSDELGGSPRRSVDQEQRLYDADTLAQNAEEWLDSLGLPRDAKVSEIRSKIGVSAKDQAAVKRAETEVAAARAALEEADGQSADLSSEDIEFYAREAAEGIWHTLTGRDGGFENSIAAVVQGPLKGRTFNIPDVDVEDFLDADAHNVLGNYIRTMSAEIELTKRFGSPDMAEIVGKPGARDRGSVGIEFDEMVAKAGDGEDAAALNKERDKTIATIEAARDRVRGTYMAKENGTGLAAAVRSANAFNFVRMLGDVVLSSSTDVFRVAQVHGLENFLGPEGLKIIGKSIKAIKANKELRTFLRDEPELAGIAEVFLNSRVQGMADLHDPYARGGPIESFTRALSNVGGQASGVNHWNQMWKQIAFQHGVQRFKRIAEAGFDGNWEDSRAVSIFRAAMRADTDSVIITPGAGDKPLFVSHPIGALAFQFKSFFLASHQRGLMRGLGEDQTSFLTGSAMMVGMGAAVYYMKGLSGNFEVSDNPGVWIAEGIDRSGVVALAMELNNTIEPTLNRMGAGGVYTGLAGAFGGSEALSSRYKFRRDFIGEAVLGPTASTIKDAKRVVEDVLGGNVKEGTVGAGGRLLPFANHPGIKQFMKYYAVPELKEAAQ